ncbi:methyltransferase domain-containing protein [Reichenbachiella agarivorans]|uniref:protein-glutamate O-methyltransferase n=1 Tax=Reichenbachiella agarivorans TaxID=2979464 RepID=A0ABY6CNX3_9BACT|nr:CheR family methyltransferase [Reichenbachiella agarivorans]UXP32074.1 methyltransferase domain-containing protein [Reichenbachiella agarivorans]
MEKPSLKETITNPLSRKTLSQSEFLKLSEFITANYGIKLPDHKKVMVEGRLQKRLKELNLNSFAEYIDMVLGNEETVEVVHMINAVSTNKTDFFRESAHFDFMNEVVLPRLFEEKRASELKIWSSAASTGEEIYTIAIVMEEYMKRHSLTHRSYSVMGTDISVDALHTAVNGVYNMSRIANLSHYLKQTYFLKSKDPNKPIVRVKPELRAKTSFGRLNLMDEEYLLDDMYDIIFCRNVLIYFDRPNQDKVISRLVRRLRPGGYLFLGHSESLFKSEPSLKLIKPTIYQKSL